MKAIHQPAAVQPEGEKALATRLYRAFYRIRRVEEEIARIYPPTRSRAQYIFRLGRNQFPSGYAMSCAVTTWRSAPIAVMRCISPKAAT